VQYALVIKGRGRVAVALFVGGPMFVAFLTLRRGDAWWLGWMFLFGGVLAISYLIPRRRER
jgi:hypothetical protein